MKRLGMIESDSSGVKGHSFLGFYADLLLWIYHLIASYENVTINGKIEYESFL